MSSKTLSVPISNITVPEKILIYKGCYRNIFISNPVFNNMLQIIKYVLLGLVLMAPQEFTVNVFKHGFIPVNFSYWRGHSNISLDTTNKGKG